MKFPKSKISTKAFTFLLIVSLTPLIVVSYVLVSSANKQLLNAAGTKQQIVASDLADKVDDYLAGKIRQLAFLSQLTTDFSNPARTNQNLNGLMKQDQATDSIYYLDAKGFERAGYDRNGPILKSSNTDKSGSDAYKAAYFLAGKAYISTVSYNHSNNPFVTVAVPILSPNSTNKTGGLTPSNKERFGTVNDISGVIVANYNISDLWESVLSTKVGTGGYAYVVDGLGNLVAHPDRQYLISHKKIADVQAVEQFRSGALGTEQTQSETGRAVISTPRPLSKVGWAVIVEEPVASIYSSRNSYIKLSTIVGISAIILSVLVAIYFSRQLTEPIKKLSIGAKKLGAGELDQVVDIKSNDELEELADTFNSMGLNIEHLVNQLRSNNLDLETERKKLDITIASVSDGIIALNAKGLIVSVNPPVAKLVGKQPDDLKGKNMQEILPWEYDNMPFTPETTIPGIYQYSDLELKIGQKISYLEIAVFVLDRQDSDVAAILTIRDLTQSRELDFLKLDFVAIAAHELRTPLTVIRGYLDMLNSDAVSQMSILNVENLQKAIVGSNQLRMLINKLLSIAQIERGEMEIIIEKLNIVNLVRNNVMQHQTQAAQRLQRLTCTIGPDIKPIYVPADESSITEVLNNLIGNAIKYTEENGEIQVNLVLNGDEVRIEVWDDGPGIPEDLRKRLFTKFYRAERSLIAGTRGTGLGLFISKTIIELHKGRIGLGSDTGRGSKFYFTLPVYKPELHDKLVSKNNLKGGVRGWYKKRTHN